MHVKFLSSALLFLLLSAWGGAASGAGNPPLKAGMPCVEEICVGDDIGLLMQVAWRTAVIPDTDVPLTRSRVSAGTFARLSKVLRGDPDALLAVAPYWVAHQFDLAGLHALEGLRAICENPGVSGRLKGTYVSQEGYRTVVGIEPVASGDGKALRFVVASVRQYIGQGETHSRIEAIGGEMAARYSGLPRFASATEAAAAWIAHSTLGPHLRLLAPVGDSVQRDIDLRNHPECLRRESEPAAMPAPA